MSEQEPVGWIPDWSFEHLVGGIGDRHPIMFWPMPQDKTGLVPLFANPAEAAPPQWTKEPPKASGHYWVWQPKSDWPCHGEVMTALVDEIATGRFRARTPTMSFAEYLGPLPLHDVWQSALWLGPIAAPAPPTKEMQA